MPKKKPPHDELKFEKKYDKKKPSRAERVKGSSPFYKLTTSEEISQSG